MFVILAWVQSEVNTLALMVSIKIKLLTCFKCFAFETGGRWGLIVVLRPL